MKHRSGWLAIGFLLLQHTAHADSELCAENAPLLDSGHYYEIAEHQPIPDNQLNLLRKFSKSLHGNWRGKERTALCVGHFENPTAVNNDYTVRAEISTSERGAVRLAADKELIDRSVSKLQTIWLTPETESLSRRQQWHTLEFIDRNTLIYSHKYRTTNQRQFQISGGGTVEKQFSRLVHEINKLSYRGRELSIDRKIYVNGTIVEQTGITLNRS